MRKIQSVTTKIVIPMYIAACSINANAALTRAKSVLEGFSSDLRVIAPVLGALILGGLG